MTPKRLVLLVEGEGDVQAAPVLLKRLLAEQQAFDVVFPDPAPLCVHGFGKVCKNDFGEWRRFLQNAVKRKNVGGCLLLLDGDSRARVDGQPFCAMRAARRLAEEARKVGGGAMFSVAVVFACLEFESWLLAGVSSLVGKRLPSSGIELPGRIPSTEDLDLESAPRDAKRELARILGANYRSTRDQSDLTSIVDLTLVRQRMRSFRRLEHAVHELVDAIRGGTCAVTPTAPA